MKRRTVITTGDVAEHCQVSYETVKNWIRQGKLPAFETPGGHHRILIENFRTFLDTYGMPAYGQTFGTDTQERSPRGLPRILIIDTDSESSNKVVDFCRNSGEYECTSAGDGFQAGMKMVAFRPDLVLLDFLSQGTSGFDICKTIKTDPETRGTIVLATTDRPEGGNMSSIYECGADDGLVKPFKLEDLITRIAKLLASRSKAGSHPPT